MALDETTRQVNQRAVRALETAEHRILQAQGELHGAIAPLEDLSRVTNAHNVALKNLRDLKGKVVDVWDDLARRLKAESEGE